MTVFEVAEVIKYHRGPVKYLETPPRHVTPLQVNHDNRHAQLRRPLRRVFGRTVRSKGLLLWSAFSIELYLYSDSG